MESFKDDEEVKQACDQLMKYIGDHPDTADLGIDLAKNAFLQDKSLKALCDSIEKASI